jgi:CBS domain-containing protein
MQVKDIMTTEPACCTSDSTLQNAAQMMIDHDCGEIPVVDNFENYTPIGVITDRDITCRTVAKGLNPLELQVADCMSTPLISVKPGDSLDKCYQVLEENQIRRVPVVSDDGKICGIVALADIARNASRADSGEVLQEVSASSISASNVG